MSDTSTIRTTAGYSFPRVRLRRLRRSESLRTLVRETEISPQDLILPLFIREGTSVSNDIPSMPGVRQQSIDLALSEIKTAWELGIRAVLLFGIPNHKDEVGSQAYDEHGVVQVAVSEIKDRFAEMIVITDVCLCEYTSHGHCGVVRDGDVQNDDSLELLARTALSHVRAGADIVAPSNMMDGTVLTIRELLDAEGFQHVPIMAYSAKYASCFYGPFREAAESAPAFGDRRSYQMDPANVREAIREVDMDVIEGADIVMVKPALAYLDVISKVKERFDLPVAAYNVSGEFAMVKAAAMNGWLDERRAVMEILTGIKRAGADMIISYHSLDVCSWLSE